MRKGLGKFALCATVLAGSCLILFDSGSNSSAFANGTDRLAEPLRTVASVSVQADENGKNAGETKAFAAVSVQAAQTGRAEKETKVTETTPVQADQTGRAEKETKVTETAPVQADETGKTSEQTQTTAAETGRTEKETKVTETAPVQTDETGKNAGESKAAVTTPGQADETGKNEGETKAAVTKPGDENGSGKVAALRDTVEQKSGRSGKAGRLPKLKQPKLTVRAAYEKHVTLSWKKVPKAKYYRIYRAGSGKFARLKQTGKRTFTDKSAKAGKTYRYKVEAGLRVKGKAIRGKASKAFAVYVRPKNPLTVICGECFVEGMHLYARSELPSGYRLIYKVGLSTYGMLNTNFISYKGQTITAVERIAYYNPDRVFFLVGMNENKGPSASATIARYRKIISLLKKSCPHVEIVLLALPPVAHRHGSGFASNTQIARYNRAYANLAKELENVYYYSGYRKKITASDGTLSSFANGGDGGHWSAKGTISAVRDIIKYADRLTKSAPGQ